jgi:hypothetical protein
MVTQRGAGANMSVDIASAPVSLAAPIACVQGDSVAGQGMYVVGPHSATVNEVIATADATNPRIDQVILEVLDNVHDASGSNLARTRVLTGTPTVGATLANRTGVATLPGSALLLADILVGAAAASITNTVIRDRRKFARGAYNRILLNHGSNYTTTVGPAAVDTTSLQFRLECSGVPVRIHAAVDLQHSVANAFVTLIPWVDSVNPDGFTGAAHWQVQLTTNAASDRRTEFWHDALPAAGSHLFALAFGVVTAGTLTIVSSATVPILFSAEEVIRQNTANNTTTSG